MPRLLALSFLGLLATACAPRRPAPGAANEPRPDVVLEGAHLRSYEGDTLQVSGTASRVNYRRAGGEVQATEVVVRLPPGKGSPASQQEGTTITAPNMDGSLASKRWVGSGGVVVQTAEGLVANTPRLTYDSDARRAHGDEGVTMRGPDYQMRADRFTLSSADQTFTFEGTVQAVLGGATE
ncbi:LPS export ABC transporter periplasmic protein LptC [Corallococcus sp. AB011P]|uniref:LPS export ABC transporter periplasmic protein LptC n=1 Tax=unclassified Corallococcus TaxID=2685029 RepID=UPI000EA09D4A|nr:MULTISPECIES: LPS export ABC transporter periplasmic protein LptC [unclassified Corallococcus]RKG60644.1 LPS export ABC transporter periplasmic protein LptC [Corallococcus sp. AB011P]RKH87985.1 LPS export ABC transporter periplasmic protein LptC [Corallococcus sp. AB045]